MSLILSLILSLGRLVVKVLWKIISLYILSRYIGSYLVHKNPTALAVGVSAIGTERNDSFANNHKYTTMANTISNKVCR